MLVERPNFVAQRSAVVISATRSRLECCDAERRTTKDSLR